MDVGYYFFNYRSQSFGVFFNKREKFYKIFMVLLTLTIISFWVDPIIDIVCFTFSFFCIEKVNKDKFMEELVLITISQIFNVAMFKWSARSKIYMMHVTMEWTQITVQLFLSLPGLYLMLVCSLNAYI